MFSGEVRFQPSDGEVKPLDCHGIVVRYWHCVNHFQRANARSKLKLRQQCDLGGAERAKSLVTSQSSPATNVVANQ
jgi:hypothetical protein